MSTADSTKSTIGIASLVMKTTWTLCRSRKRKRESTKPKHEPNLATTNKNNIRGNRA